MLLRDGADGIEVLVQRRAATMAFAASRVVFPGGATEPSDADDRAAAVREVAEETGLTLRASDLLEWGRWVTPEHSAIRYDTAFFLASAPPQEPRNLTTEAVELFWAAPQRLLATEAAALMPPTEQTLRSLLPYARAADALAAAAGPVRLVRAGNPGPLTLEGTNSWIIGGVDQVVVVDPGPDLPGHRHSLLAAIAGRQVAAVLLTHGHADHAEVAGRLAAAVGAPVRARAPGLCIAAEPLRPGESVSVDGVAVEVVPTPGHSDDSVSFLLPQSGRLLTGDTVLGRGPSLIDHPEGRLGDYLGSLERLAALTAAGRVTGILPGHGPEIADPAPALAALIEHRRRRLDQVRDARAAGAGSVEEVVALVYADVERTLWPAAARSVAAQLAYLDVEISRRDG